MDWLISVDDLKSRLNGRSIAIFGASSGGQAVYEYLKSIDLLDKVMLFIDSDPRKHGKTLYEKPIFPPQHLINAPDIVIITIGGNTREMGESIRSSGMKNELFSFHNFMPPYGTDNELVNNLDYISSFYNKNDSYTLNTISAAVRYRTDSSVSHIHPYDSITDKFAGNYLYWTGDHALKEDALTIVDAGAFVGDSMQDLFSRYNGRIRAYHAFEPDVDNFRLLAKTAEKYRSMASVFLHNYALLDSSKKIFINGANAGAVVSSSGREAECRALDSLDIELHGKLCIKMDIEGSELSMLKGAENTIRKYKPNIASCVYHKHNDLHEIPAYLKSLVTEYDLSIRGMCHMVCYAEI